VEHPVDTHSFDLVYDLLAVCSKTIFRWPDDSNCLQQFSVLAGYEGEEALGSSSFSAVNHLESHCPGHPMRGYLRFWRHPGMLQVIHRSQGIGSPNLHAETHSCDHKDEVTPIRQIENHFEGRLVSNLTSPARRRQVPRGLSNTPSIACSFCSDRFI
jgi:hypothetical protein